MITADRKDGKMTVCLAGDRHEVINEFLDILTYLTAQSEDKVGFVATLCEYLQSENFANSVKLADDYRKEAGYDKH